MANWVKINSGTALIDADELLCIVPGIPYTCRITGSTDVIYDTVNLVFRNGVSVTYCSSGGCGQFAQSIITQLEQELDPKNRVLKEIVKDGNEGICCQD